MSTTLALTRLRVAGYVRGHRAFQPLVGLFAILAIMYATSVPAGAELTSYADSAALLIPVFAWASRGLLDAEPDEQRMIVITSRGRAELVGGLLAAFTAAGTLAVIALVWPLIAGFAALPDPATLLMGIGLHVLGVLTGVTLGALTSRPILPSPAVSLLALLGGYFAIIMVSIASPWLTVPAMSWMRAAAHGELPGLYAQLVATGLAWCAIGLCLYAWLRRTRP